MRYRTLPDDMMDKAAVYGGTPLVIDNSEEEEFVLELLKNTTGRFTMGVGYQNSRSRYENHVTGEPIGYMGRFKEPLQGPFHSVFFIEAQTGYWYADWAFFATCLIVEIEGGSEIDTDGDGIPDADEIAGISATNGKIYYSDPELFDTDGDGLSDGEELNYFGRRTSQGVIPLRNLRKMDSDADGFLDPEDAIPLSKNKDAMYIFSIDEFAREGQIMKNMYERKTRTPIFVLNFRTADELIRLWDTIGLYATYPDGYLEGDYSKPYGDKYYYNPLSVTLDCHGDVGNILVVGNELFVRDPSIFNDDRYDFHSFNELSNKRMKYLYLLVCYSAYDGEDYLFFHDYASDREYIMADSFLENNDIRRGIYAYDGISVFAPNMEQIDYCVYSDGRTSRFGLVFINENYAEDVYLFDVINSANDVEWVLFYSINTRIYDPILDFIIG